MNGIDIPLEIALGPFVQAMQQAASAVANFQATVSQTEKRLTDVERSSRTMGQGLSQIMAKVNDDWNRATMTGAQYRIEQIQREAKATERAILESNGTRQETIKGLTRLAETTEAQITAVHRDEAGKRQAVTEQEAAKRTAAMQRMGIAAGVMFAAAAGTIGATAKSYGDLEATINTIGAVSDATAGDLGRLKQAATQIGIDTQFSTQQAANGFLELAKAGLTAEQQMTAMPGVIAMAGAAAVDLGKAAEYTIGITRAFNLEISQTTRVADVLAQAANQSSVDVKDLAESFKYIAPVAAASNQSMEDMSGILAILGNQMIKGEQAGTSMRASILKLQAPSKEAAAALRTVGLDIADASGKMRPFGDIIKDLADKTTRFNEISRARIFENIFGQEAVSAISALTNQARQAPQAFDGMLQKMRDAEGQAQRTADQINKGLNFALAQLGSTAEVAGQQLGEKFAPDVTAAAQALTGLLNLFNQSGDGVKRSVAVGVEVGGAIAGVGLLAVAAAQGIRLYKESLLILTSEAPKVAAGMRAIGAALTTTVSGPVGLAIAALAALVFGYQAVTDAQEQEQNALADLGVAQQNQADRMADLTEKQGANIAQSKFLAAELENLARKKNRTAEETKRLHDIQDQLRKLNPGLRATIDQVATGHAHASDLINQQARAYDNARAAAIRFMAAAIAAAQIRIDERQGRITSLASQIGRNQDDQDALSADFRGRGPARRLANPQDVQKLSTEVEQNSADSALLTKAQKRLTDLLNAPAAADIKPVKAGADNYGGGSNYQYDGSRGKGGSGSASSAAREQFQAFKEARDNDIKDAQKHQQDQIKLWQDQYQEGRKTAVEFFQDSQVLRDETTAKTLAALEAIRAKAKPGSKEAADVDGRIKETKADAGAAEAEAQRRLSKDLQALDDADRQHAIEAAKAASDATIAAKEDELARGKVTYAEYAAFRDQQLRVIGGLETSFLKDQVGRYAEDTKNYVDAKASLTTKDQQLSAQRAANQRKDAAEQQKLTEAAVQANREAAQRGIDAELAALDLKHQQGLVSEQQFVVAKNDLTRQSMQMAVDAAEAETRRYVDGTAEKIAAEKRLADAKAALNNQDLKAPVEKAAAGIKDFQTALSSVTTIASGAAGSINTVAAAMRSSGDPKAADQADTFGKALGFAGDAAGIAAGALTGNWAAAVGGSVSLVGKGVSALIEWAGKVDAARRAIIGFKDTIDSITGTPVRKLADQVTAELGEDKNKNLGIDQVAGLVNARARGTGVDPKQLMDSVLLLRQIENQKKILGNAESDLSAAESTFKFVRLAPESRFAGEGGKEAAVNRANQVVEAARLAVDSGKKQLVDLQADLEKTTEKTAAGIAESAESARNRINASSLPAAIKADMLRGIDEAQLSKVEERLKNELNLSPEETKALTDQYDELGKRIGKSAGKLASDVSDKLDGLLKDRAKAAQSATGDAGNRISIEQRAQLDIDRLDRDYNDAKQKRAKDLASLRREHAKAQEDDLQKVRDLEDEIYKSRQDEAKRLKEIENEGIAVRQESVEKIKADRSQEVRDEASKLRAGASNQITAIRTEMRERNDQYQERLLQIDEEGKKADTEHANAVSRIKSQLKEQQAAHTARMTTLDREISAERQLLGMTQDRLAALIRIAEMEASKNAGYSTGGNSGGAGGGGTGLADYGTNLQTQTFGPGQNYTRTSSGVYSGPFGTFTADQIPALKQNGLLPQSFYAFAKGGLIDKPTLGLIGERGPELAIPPNVTSLLLDAANRGQGAQVSGGNLIIQIESFSGSDQDYRRLEREMDRYRRDRYRNNGNWAN